LREVEASGEFKKAWAEFQAFVKAEKLCGFVQGPEVGPQPLGELIDRLIQGPHDATYIIAGPGLKPTCKRLKKLWNSSFPIFYAAVNPSVLREWFNTRYRPGMLGLLGDYTMYDNSHNDFSWDYVESLYQRLGLYNIPWFAEVMRAWRQPCGSLSGGRGTDQWKIKYRAYTMNASGRDDTAFANALLNGLAYSLSLIATIKHKIVDDLTEDDVLELFPGLNLSVMGDDSLALLESHYYYEGFNALLESNIGRFGFKIKLNVSDDPFQFVYLGMRPYPANGQWWFAKTIGRALYKWGWKLDQQGKDLPALMTGEAEATLKTDPVVPILSDAAAAYFSSRRGCKISPPLYDDKPWKEADPEMPRYTTATLAYVAQGYGVSYSELLDCVNYISSTPSFPCVWDHPVLTAIVLADET
jgi:hypothetical protein